MPVTKFRRVLALAEFNTLSTENYRASHLYKDFAPGVPETFFILFPYTNGTPNNYLSSLESLDREIGGI